MSLGFCPNPNPTLTLTLLPPSLLPQIKFGLVPAYSAADLEEEDPAWGTRVGRFDHEYKLALAEAMGVQPQLSRRKMPLLMALIIRAVVDKAKRQGVVNLDELETPSWLNFSRATRCYRNPLSSGPGI